MKPKLKVRLRNYHCPACEQTIKRMSDKYWIRSMCDSSGYKTVRITLITKTSKTKNHGKKDQKKRSSRKKSKGGTL